LPFLLVIAISELVSAIARPSRSGEAPRLSLSRLGEGMVEPQLRSHFVLDNNCKLSYIITSDLLLTRSALARRRSVGAGTVPPQDTHPCDRGWPTLAPLGGPLKQTGREAASRLFHHHRSSSRAALRATLDHPQARSPWLRAPSCWLFDTATFHCRHPVEAQRRSGIGRRAWRGNSPPPCGEELEVGVPAPDLLR
jgi:hypothetical protein